MGIGLILSSVGGYLALTRLGDISPRAALILVSIAVALLCLAIVPQLWKALVHSDPDSQVQQQVETGSGLGFWLGLAPLIFLAGWRFFLVPAFLLLGALNLDGAAFKVLTWVAHALGFLVGGTLVWMLRRQLRSYSEKDAA